MSEKNYKLTIAYDGTRYFGWEHQPDRDTIQGKLEAVLSRMCDKEVEVIGAGRTDAGVHARAMVANAKLDTALTPEKIRDYMNKYLPEDIAVRDVKIAGDQFHARYKALSKTYRYTIHTGEVKPIFDRKYMYVLGHTLDIQAMEKAAGYLMGEHDFKSFCGNSHFKKSSVRLVDTIAIAQNKDKLTLTFHGTGFLQNMVRILTGTLIEVGEGKYPPEHVIDILEACDRKQAGPTAPACGLCLMFIDY